VIGPAPHWFADEDGASGVVLEGRVGSPFVPRLERVHRYVTDLISRLEGLKPADLRAWIGAHNLYTVYVYLTLLWATAVRPCRDPLITRESLRGPPGWIIVADKDNRDYWERRPVPACGLVWDLLGELERGTESFCRWLGSQGHPVAVDDQALFVIIRGGEGKALTPEHARGVLEAEGLTYRWKFNAARHAWVSMWLAMERPLTRIEAFLGHVHTGQEPWGPFSLASLRSWGDEFRAGSEEVLNMIGARMLAHPFAEDRA